MICFGSYAAKEIVDVVQIEVEYEYAAARNSLL